MKKLKLLITGLGIATFGEANADYALNLSPGVTQLSRDIYDLHMYILWICVAIGVGVYGMMVYSIMHHRKSKGAVAAHFHENTKLEVVWTIIPFVILLAMAIPATKVMIEAYDTSASDMTVKVTGYQWKWRYTYLDNGIDFFSTLDAKSNEARQLGVGSNPEKVPNYLLEVDKPLVIPVGRKVRFLFTAADVIHSWWVPQFGWKKDAIPGYVTDAWTKVEHTGIYRGQCAELCGRDHGFMPIVVDVRSEEDYAQWVAEQKAHAQQSVADAAKTYSMAELMAKGEEVYNSSCAGCHMVNGEGMQGMFPAIKGSAVATGDLGTHLDVVVKGKGQMMPAFGDSLSPVEIAAVVTFQRNGFGNNKGDLVQPSDISARH